MKHNRVKIWKVSVKSFVSYISKAYFEKVKVKNSIWILDSQTLSYFLISHDFSFPFAMSKGRRKVCKSRGGTVCWMGFYVDISWESRCSSEINVWINFYQILLVFEVPSWLQVKRMSGNSYNYQKLIKDTPN